MSDLSMGLLVASLSMVGTLLALSLIAVCTWALGRYLKDPPEPPAATSKVPAQTASGH